MTESRQQEPAGDPPSSQALIMPPGPSSATPSRYSPYSRPSRFHPEYNAVFCGLRKSLREILQSKNSSYLCNVTPMMYSQRDLFYSPRSRRNDQDGETPHDPKAHLHYNSAVRQAVEQYSDVLTNMKCRHMNSIVAEVMCLCPLLENDMNVKTKIIGSIKSYIFNAVAHYKRKQKKMGIKQDIASSDALLGGTDDSEMGPSSDVDEYQDSPGSYPDDLIDYSTMDEVIPVTVKDDSPSDDGVIFVQSHSGAVSPPTVHGSHAVSSVKSHPTSSQHCRSSYLRRESLTPGRSSNIEIASIKNVNMETSCVASSVERDDTEFRFSDSPTMEDLRAVQADFAKVRDWDQFHQPRNLLLAMVGEVGEVSELFQWRGECQEGLEDWSEKDKKHLGQELSDVLMYLIRLAEKCHVDLPRAAMEKLGLNNRKYPAYKVRGSSKKYNEYD